MREYLYIILGWLFLLGIAFVAVWIYLEALKNIFYLIYGVWF